MSGDRKESSSIIPPSLIALVLAGVAYVVYQPSLESARPGATDFKGLESGELRVQARLWQDPFWAVTDHKKRDGEKTEDVKLTIDIQGGKPLRVDVKTDGANKHHQIDSLVIPSEDKAHVKVMMVMTKGGPYEEDHESRLRDRNAILSALGVACFIPKDQEHINYFEWPPSSTPRTTDSSLITVPYEWLEPRKLRVCGEEMRVPERVLVLWFQEDDLGWHPLKTLSEVWDGIIKLNEKAKLSLAILGPRSSSGLRTMLEGTLESEQSPIFKGLSNIEGGQEIELWSPWATVDDELLVYSLRKSMQKDCSPDGHLEDRKPAYTCVAEAFQRRGVKLFRTIPSDHKLVETLLGELRSRNKIEPLPIQTGSIPHEKGKIAIVSEWDTFYGRSLPLEFRRTICTDRREPKCSDTMNALERFVNYPAVDESSGVIRYSYFRGLDGKIPGSDVKQSSKKVTAKEAPTVKEAIHSISLSEMERPVGESQLDYTRRLAKVIRERDEREKSICDLKKRFIHQCGGIEAIGVTGSDVYDKLLILQALRQSFPDKAFFTTDLDDRYADPEQIKWTRNLLVASHFGLRLEDRIQRDIPPFRDSYQTSAYYAALRSLKILRCKDSSDNPNCPSGIENILDGTQLYDSAIHVRLYEVGNKGPVDISLYRNQVDSRNNLSLLHERTIPPFGKTDLFSFILYLVIAGTLGLGLLCRTTSLYSRILLWAKEELSLKISSLFVSLALGVFALASWTLLAQGTTGEPVVALTHGISIWPTEGIRLAVIILSAIFFHIARRQTKNPFGSFPADLKLRLTSTLHAPSQDSHDHRGIAPHQFWLDYLAEGRFRLRIIRSSVIAILLFALGITLLVAIDQEFPSAPCRGTSACMADGLLTLLSVTCLLLLISFVFDASRLSRVLIDKLNSGDTDWNPEGQSLAETLEAQDSTGRRALDIYRKKAECDWWDVRFVAEFTAGITPLVYFPFIALFLMIFARSPLFDSWHYPYGLVIIFSLSSSMCLTSAFWLRGAAEKSRIRALVNLRSYLAEVLGQNDSLEKFIRHRIEDVENIQKGAYASFIHRPEIQTLGLVAASIFQVFINP